MKRMITILVSVMALALFAVGCAASTGDSAAATPAMAAETAAASDATATDPAAAKGSAADGTLELTLDQLKQYDGKNGNPAYVAVDGIIYDVSNVSAWKNGDHNGYSAGNDLTDIIKNKSPHGVKNLVGLPVVGKLVAG